MFDGYAYEMGAQVSAHQDGDLGAGGAPALVSVATTVQGLADWKSRLTLKVTPVPSESGLRPRCDAAVTCAAAAFCEASSRPVTAPTASLCNFHGLENAFGAVIVVVVAIEVILDFGHFCSWATAPRVMPRRCRSVC